MSCRVTIYKFALFFGCIVSLLVKLRWWFDSSMALENKAWINSLCWKQSAPHSKSSHCRSSKVESWHTVNPCTATTTRNNFISYSAQFQTNLLRSPCRGECAPRRKGLSAGSYILLFLCVLLPLLQSSFLSSRCQKVIAQTCLLNSRVPVFSAHTLFLPLRSQLSFLSLHCLKTDYCWCRRRVELFVSIGVRRW